MTFHLLFIKYNTISKVFSWLNEKSTEFNGEKPHMIDMILIIIHHFSSNHFKTKVTQCVNLKSEIWKNGEKRITIVLISY